MTQSVTSHETDAMACTQSVNTPVSQSVSQTVTLALSRHLVHL